MTLWKNWILVTVEASFQTFRLLSFEHDYQNTEGRQRIGLNISQYWYEANNINAQTWSDSSDWTVQIYGLMTHFNCLLLEYPGKVDRVFREVRSMIVSTYCPVVAGSFESLGRQEELYFQVSEVVPGTYQILLTYSRFDLNCAPRKLSVSPG